MVQIILALASATLLVLLLLDLKLSVCSTDDFHETANHVVQITLALASVTLVLLLLDLRLSVCSTDDFHHRQIMWWRFLSRWQA